MLPMSEMGINSGTPRVLSFLSLSLNSTFYFFVSVYSLSFLSSEPFFHLHFTLEPVGFLTLQFEPPSIGRISQTQSVSVDFPRLGVGVLPHTYSQRLQTSCHQCIGSP